MTNNTNMAGNPAANSGPGPLRSGGAARSAEMPPLPSEYQFPPAASLPGGEGPDRTDTPPQGSPDTPAQAAAGGAKKPPLKPFAANYPLFAGRSSRQDAANDDPSQPQVQRPEMGQLPRPRPRKKDTSIFENLPPKLRDNCACCVWKYVSRPGATKPAKVPYNPITLARANSADSRTFSSYEKAREVYENGGYDGIGVGIFGSLVAIDIDHCLDADGRPSDMAQDICLMMDGAYTEISPSGRGLRILATVPDGYTFNKSNYMVMNHKLGLEVYVAGATSKYVSVTGQTLSPGVDLGERGAELASVLEKYMRRPKSQIGGETDPVVLPEMCGMYRPQLLPADRGVIDAIRGSRSAQIFDALARGDTSAYGGDWSAAEQAFINIVAARTRDVESINRIYLNSRLARAKWHEPRGDTTYGAMTIANALRSVNDKNGPKSLSADLLQVVARAATKPTN